MKENIEIKNIPLIDNKKHDEQSVFKPEKLIREARRQNNRQKALMPEVCILDPDGDIVNYLLKEQRAELNSTWACYHTNLYNFTYDDMKLGIIGYAVGSSFSVLVAEELFECGCKLLISVTSAGQITPLTEPPPYFILIEKALRDEGTSYHYLPPSLYSHINDELFKMMTECINNNSLKLCSGSSWTTDAPFRETEAAILYARKLGIIAVEMEAAALYAFADSKQKSVICFAHVTNQLGNNLDDFEKGANNGSIDSLNVISKTAKKWLVENKNNIR